MSDTPNATETPVVDVADNSPVENQDAPTPTQETHNDDADTFSREYVENLRKENASYRVKAKEAAEAAAKAAEADTRNNDLIKKLGTVLGFVKDDAELDPEQLIKDVTAERDNVASERDKYQQELNSLRTENALTKAANSHNADLDLIIPFLRGTGALDALDPSADDFNSQVDTAVADLIKSNPKFSTTRVGASGVDTTNHSGQPKPITRADLETMTAKEIYEAQAAGRLNHLL